MAHLCQYGLQSNYSERMICSLLEKHLPDTFIILSNYGTTLTKEIDAVVITNRIARMPRDLLKVIFVIEIKNYEKFHQQSLPNVGSIKTFAKTSKQAETNSYRIKDQVPDSIAIPMIINAKDDVDLSELDMAQQQTIITPNDLTGQKCVSTFDSQLELFITGKMPGIPYTIEEIDRNEVLEVLKQLAPKPYDDLKNGTSKRDRSFSEPTGGLKGDQEDDQELTEPDDQELIRRANEDLQRFFREEEAESHSIGLHLKLPVFRGNTWRDAIAKFERIWSYSCIPGSGLRVKN